MEVSKLVNRALSYKSDEAAACCGGSASLLGKSCFMFVHTCTPAGYTYLPSCISRIYSNYSSDTFLWSTYVSLNIYPAAFSNQRVELYSTAFRLLNNPTSDIIIRKIMNLASVVARSTDAPSSRSNVPRRTRVLFLHLRIPICIFTHRLFLSKRTLTFRAR